MESAGGMMRKKKAIQAFTIVFASFFSHALLVAGQGTPSSSTMSGTTTAPLLLKLRAVNSTVRAGTIPQVQITIVNTSNGPVLMEVRPSTWLFSFDVRNSQGKQSPSRRGRVLADPTHKGIQPQDYPPLEGGPAEEIFPGKSVVMNNIPVSDLHDLSQPGTYMITVHRAYGGSIIKSNSIAITVIP
jgi:hypothetical protein